MNIIKANKIPKFNQLHVYSSANYDSFEEAKKDNAIFSTEATIENVCLESLDEGKGFDTIEIFDIVTRCLGLPNDLAIGILSVDNTFIELPIEIDWA